MSTIEGGQTPRGGELPKKQELTVADLLAEVRAPRPGEEADLEAPIVAEGTAGKVANITQPTADIRENTSGKSHDNMRVHKNNIRSLVTGDEISFYTFDPVTKEISPIDGLQGIAHQISKRVNADRIFTDEPFVIEYADTRKGRWVSVFNMASKKVTPLIQMEVSGKIDFEGDMIRVQRNGKEDMYFFYKNGEFYEFDTKEYLGYGSLLSGLMRKVTGNPTEKKPIPHDFETARKYLKPVTTPVVVK